MVGEKEIPYCTIFLVLAAFISNILVLIGNLDAAASFNNIGQSTGGWSDVGLGMAKAFDNELDYLMNEATLSLTHAVKDIDTVQNEIDMMISLMGAGSDTKLLQVAKDTAHVAIKHGTSNTNPFKKIEDDALSEISSIIHTEVGKVNGLLQTFLKGLTPTLLQIGKWEISFGKKLQNDITQFSTTLDWVQKQFDAMMAKLKGGDNTWEDYMFFNTFNLFDPQANDCITQDSLLGAAKMYGITSLSGVKGEQVFKTYSKNGCINHEGYRQMATDPGLHGVVTTVLRTYAEGIAKVGGTVGQARLRAEVAAGVVTYLDFVSVKNHTKVGWVTERLTNSSVPLAFTACVMRELAIQSTNPNNLATINVGQLVIDFMVYMNTGYTMKALHSLTQPSWWKTEGFLSNDLTDVVDILSKWIKKAVKDTKAGTNPAQILAKQMAQQAEALEKAERLEEKEHPTKDTNATKDDTKHDDTKDDKDKHAKDNHDNDKHAKDTKHHALLLQEAMSTGSLDAAEALLSSEYVESAKASALAEIAVEKHREHLAVVERRENLTSSHTSKHLFKELLGGKTMSTGKLTPAEWECLHSGVPAVPATLEFAHYLSENCSVDSHIFLHACFKYSSMSSNQLDAFANEVQSFVGKTQSFLTTTAQYSGPKGIHYLEEEIMGFVTRAENTIIGAIEPKISQVVKTVIKKVESLNPGVPLKPDSILKEIEHDFELLMAGKLNPSDLMLAQVEVNPEMAVFDEISTLLKDLMALLPSAAKTVKTARGEVQQVAQLMASVFTTFSIMGPALFNDVSLAYGALWTIYFILLLPLTLGTLWYGMWASGWMGGPQAADWPEETEEEAARPKSFIDQMRTCYTACCICCGKCHDSLICFWSCLIVYQVIVLVIFIVAIVLCMLNGVKVFLTSSCVQIYMLDQDDMCQNVINSVKGFISTFTVDAAIPLEETCNKKSLLMCELIASKMQTSMIYTTIFSFASAIFQYQLVIESAVLHERAAMRRKMKELRLSED